MPNTLSDAAVAGLRAIAHDLGAPMLVQRIAEPGAMTAGDFYASYRDGDAWPYASATDPRVVAFLEAWTPETAAALADEVLRLRADAARLDWYDRVGLKTWVVKYEGPDGTRAWQFGTKRHASIRDAIDAGMREDTHHA